LLMFSLNLKAEQLEMIVYRSPACGCCGNWVAYMQQNNFNVKSVMTDDMQSIKQKYGIPEKLVSCHTAIVNGYVIEGHVPAEDIINLLQKKPEITGIAAPGMPLGSPGMEMGGKKQAYRVLSFDKSGKVEIFAEHTDNQ